MTLLPLLLAACEPEERPGTFVGNPGGNNQLAATTAGTSGVSQGEGLTTLSSVVVSRCENNEEVQLLATDTPRRIVLGLERTLTGITLPTGRWCSLVLRLDDTELTYVTPNGVLSIEPGTMHVKLDLGDPLIVEPEATEDLLAEFALVLGSPDWLASVAAADPNEQGVIVPSEQQTADLVGLVERASASYDGAGRLALHGVDYGGFVNAACPTEPTPAVQPVVRDCYGEAGYEVNSIATTETCSPGLWIAGIYELAQPMTDAPLGTAQLRFAVPGRHILAVSAYDPVIWELDIGPETIIEKVLVAGYYEQRVNAIDGRDLVVQQVNGPVCGYSWPYNGGGCDTAALIDAFEIAAGVPTTRFDGCYQATTFTWEP